ncbi:lamin tail domain-containing protein [Streptomyces sp. NPDC001985]|uniref:lamin tail domain-containing protein n=1 Tax=Streptomyces sp. NPDC001985 TaxID=3154406 RepID=UPI00332ADEDD
MHTATSTAHWLDFVMLPPAPHAGGLGTGQLTWGLPPEGGAPNSLTFQGATGEIPTDGSEFVVGTLTHANRPTGAGPGFIARLALTLTFPDGRSLQNGYAIRHQETPDLGGPVDDVIDFLGGWGPGIDLDGTTYVAHVTRFAAPGRETTPSPLVNPSFASPENSDTAVSVMAVMVRTDAPDLRITTVHQGNIARTQSDEYVEILNRSVYQVNLDGWTVDAGDEGQNLALPSAILWPGRRIRIHTNEIHPEWGGFSFHSKRAIWNDKGDTATLRTPSGTVASEYRYGRA